MVQLLLFQLLHRVYRRHHCSIFGGAFLGPLAALQPLIDLGLDRGELPDDVQERLVIHGVHD